MSTHQEQDDARIAEAIVLVDKLGPILNGHSTGAIISAMSALLGTVIGRHSHGLGIKPRQVLDVVCHHAMTAADKTIRHEAGAVRH